jgi:ketosteroid isomerase-like protein
LHPHDFYLTRLREIVDGYASALARGDVDALVAKLTEDVTWSMPPLHSWYAGLPAVRDFAERPAGELPRNTRQHRSFSPRPTGRSGTDHTAFS